MIQESKLSSNYKTQNIQNFTTVQKEHRQDQGGSFLTLINKSMNFSRNPESLDTLVTHHLEELTITATLGNTEHYQCLHTPSKFNDKCYPGPFDDDDRYPNTGSLSYRLYQLTDEDELGANHLPSRKTKLNAHRTSFSLKKTNWDRYRKEKEHKFSKRQLPNNC